MSNNFVSGYFCERAVAAEAHWVGLSCCASTSPRNLSPNCVAYCFSCASRYCSSGFGEAVPMITNEAPGMALATAVMVAHEE